MKESGKKSSLQHGDQFWPSATYCVPQPARTTYTQTTTSAVSWSSGVDMRSASGINLSSRTGYSSDAWLKFVFGNNRRLCGTDDWPGAPGSRRLVAKY